MVFKDKKFIGGYDNASKILLKPSISSLHMMQPDIIKKTDYIGNAWNHLAGLLYLMYKHPKECVAIPSNLLTNSGKLSLNAYYMNFHNFCLTWDDNVKKIIAPPGLWNSVRKCLDNKNVNFIVLPLNYICIGKGGHSNFLVYDCKTKEMERFEPYGMNYSKCHNYPNLDELIKNLFNTNVRKDMIEKIYKPLDFCPLKSFQTIEEAELQKIKTDPWGFCSVWSIWYGDTRLSNPNKTRDEVVELALYNLKNYPISFTEFIRSYSAFIVKIANEIKKSNNFNAIFEKYIQKYT
jgi:hypothetical protein